MKVKASQFSFEKLFFSLGLAVFLLFSSAVLVGMSLVRSEVRQKMLQRDAALLQRVAQYLYDAPEDSEPEDWDIIDLALDSSEIEGIIAVRVFRPVDTLIEQVPETLFPVRLAPSDEAQLKNSIPIIRYFKAYPLDALFMGDSAVRPLPAEPLIEIVIPLLNSRGETVASIQYWIDGTSVTMEFAQMDRHLVLWALAFIGGGGILVTGLFILASKRLATMARLLAKRNKALQQANKDLELAAKTSAIGAVASHLFHGLKNPLAGLKAYLQLTKGDAEAMQVADQMQGLIEETLSVLKNEGHAAETEIALADAVESLRAKVNPAHLQDVVISSTASGYMHQHSLQLLQLILHNLTENAFQAKPDNNRVDIVLADREEELSIIVSDHGPGLPEAVRTRLFEPVSSTKAGGSGIGLAISAVLARHLPGSLELLDSGPQGTTFQILMRKL